MIRLAAGARQAWAATGPVQAAAVRAEFRQIMFFYQ